MFWGRGDTSQLDAKEQQTLAHLRRMVETGHIVALTHEQSETMLRALDWYQAWESTFRIARHLRNVGIVVGGLLTAWWATGGQALDFLLRSTGN